MKRTLLVTAILLTACIHLWFSYITFTFPYVNVKVLSNPNQQWQVHSLKPGDPGDRLGMRNGDIVHQINQTPASAYFSVIKWRTIEQAKQIIVHRGEEVLTLDTSSLSKFTLYEIPPMLGVLLNLGFAVFIYKRGGATQSARLLSLLFVNMGLIFMCLGASPKGDPLAKVMLGTLMMTLPIVFLHFLVVFFKEKGAMRFPLSVLGYLYGFAGLTFILRMSYFTNGANVIYSIDIFVIIPFFLIMLILILTFFIRLFRIHRTSHPQIATIIKTMGFAFALSFAPFSLLSFLPLLLFKVQWVQSYITGWFIPLFPLSFAYLMMSKQLYDIEVVLRRWLYTSLIAFLPTVVIVMVFVVFTRLPASDLMLIGVLSLGCISLVVYSLEYVTLKLERIIFPRKHKLQTALKQISNKLQSISSMRELKEVILRDMVSVLPIAGAAIVYRTDGKIEVVDFGDMDALEAAKIVEWGATYSRDYTSFVIHPEEAYRSYLILSSKQKATGLSVEEIHWVKLMVTYLAVHLENLHLIRKLTVRVQQMLGEVSLGEGAHEVQWFRKLMFDLQEKERQRIANDLHDTTMQDLFFHNRRLYSLLEKQSLNLEDQELVTNMVDHVDLMNTNLRQSCFELNPHLLREIGLIRTIEKLIEQEDFFCPFEIDWIVSQPEVIESFRLEAKRHLFRIVQELLQYAKKHSEASLIRFTLSVVEHHFRLDYEEEEEAGWGASQLSHSQEEETPLAAVGMTQLNSRVIYLNGHLAISSNTEAEMSLRISIPVTELSIA